MSLGHSCYLALEKFSTKGAQRGQEIKNMQELIKSSKITFFSLVVLCNYTYSKYMVPDFGSRSQGEI